MSLPPEEPFGLVAVRGKGNGNLLPGLIPGVNTGEIHDVSEFQYHFGTSFWEPASALF